ncbi:MBL fold metallo-hydrolase [Persicobacter psychrovividus]|uniref:MBL fold hydrolase n=1 Tax=Persicobacter psychrovividus TaxID=387638 RepID=A0ABM7VGQ6_9BACT|nr:MBL fold hydrolase [Persicobacter psychrovividus]
MQIKVFPFNAFSENTYILYDDTKEAVIIDPGCYTEEEQETLQDFIEAEGLKVVALLNTHAHVDHVLGNAFVKRTYGVKLHLHADDYPTLASVDEYAGMWGFENYEPATADETLTDGQEFTFGETTLKVLFVPGHCPGHVAFYHDDSQQVIGGDCLFHRGIGRTDLPGGNIMKLGKSLREKLYMLPDETIVYPGHGLTTTIGEEKAHNPFIRK